MTNDEKLGSMLDTVLSNLPEAKKALEAPSPNGYDPVMYLMQKASGDRLKNGLPPLKRLTNRHRAILNMHILGEKGIDIAAHFGVRNTLVSRIIHDPLGQEFLSMKLKMDDARFKALYGNAVDVIKDGMANKETMSNRLRAANIYMERKDKLEEKHGEKPDSAEDVIQRILNDPTIIQNLNLQVNNYGAAELPPKVIEQEKDDA